MAEGKAMVLYLSGQDLGKSLPMHDCIDALERGLRQPAAKLVTMPPRNVIRMPRHNAVWLVMPIYSEEFGAMTVKLISEYEDNPTKYNLPKVSGVTLLIRPTDGRLLCIMDSAQLTAIRTGAVSGVATKHLAPKNVTSVGVIGSGLQARTQLEAVQCVRNITEAKVYSPTRDHRERFATAMSESLGIEAVAVGDARTAVEGSQIVITATDSAEPVLNGAWLDDGAHVNSVGALPERRELDHTTLKRSKIVADLKESVLREAGDIISAIRQGVISEADIYAELRDIVAGVKPGRTSDREITLFKSVGFALLDLLAATRAYELAEKGGCGLRLPDVG